MKNNIIAFIVCIVHFAVAFVASYVLTFCLMMHLPFLLAWLLGAIGGYGLTMMLLASIEWMTTALVRWSDEVSHRLILRRYFHRR